jgi:hypothetical protein
VIALGCDSSLKFIQVAADNFNAEAFVLMDVIHMTLAIIAVERGESNRGARSLQRWSALKKSISSQ